MKMFRLALLGLVSAVAACAQHVDTASVDRDEIAAAINRGAVYCSNIGGSLAAGKLIGTGIDDEPTYADLRCKMRPREHRLIVDMKSALLFDTGIDAMIDTRTGAPYQVK
jgi:hypothetical protein